MDWRCSKLYLNVSFLNYFFLFLFLDDLKNNRNLKKQFNLSAERENGVLRNLQWKNDTVLSAILCGNRKSSSLVEIDFEGKM